MKTAHKFSSLSAGTGCRLPRRAVLTGVALLAGAFGWQATTARANEPKSGSYPAAVSWADGSQGGSGRVILATT